MAKIVVGMSGGVDSTVAAVLLKERGHEVLGVFLRLWKNSEPSKDDEHYTEQIWRLEQAARQIDIPFTVVDVRASFREQVVEYFIQGYRTGVTPNPCFFCNRELKWKELFAFVEREGFEFAASGHYARVENGADGDVHLYRGVDPLKDQSYVLASLRQEQLRNIWLPLGEMTKREVREVSANKKLRIAAVKESQDICFLPEGDYANFLAKMDPVVCEPGEIIDVLSGAVVGQHQGLAFYTIGQRKGLGVYAPEPRYVVEKDIAGNRLVIGPRETLGRSDMTVSWLNWIAPQPDFPFACEIEIRYHGRAYPGVVTRISDDMVRVGFLHPVLDVTPGQAAVFYSGQEVVGSGIIDVFESVGGSL